MVGCNIVKSERRELSWYSNLGGSGVELPSQRSWTLPPCRFASSHALSNVYDPTFPVSREGPLNDLHNKNQTNRNVVLCVCCIQLLHDTDQWEALVNKGLILQIP